MKKFLAIALIAASLTSCGGGKTEETPAADSNAVKVETPAPAVTVDSPAVIVDSPATKETPATKKP